MWIFKSAWRQEMQQVFVALLQERGNLGVMAGEANQLKLQLADKDKQLEKLELSLDWMRHRVNALEKERSVLLRETTKLSFPVPEIEPTRPVELPSIDALQKMFEDVGDDEAAKLGLKHDEAGHIIDKK